MHLTDRQWKNLARDLQQQRCVLFLGNRLVTDNDGAPLTDALSLHLARLLDQEGVDYEKNAAHRLHYMAQRFMTIPKIRRIDLEDEVVEFYRAYAQTVPGIYRQLARLPFSLIVNTTPDEAMVKAFRAAGKAHVQALHYNFRRERNPNILPAGPEKPLIYNLWGALDDPESLVLSQEDRVDFIKNVVKGNPAIPNAVMGHFDERKTYIFLGFNLENWDTRLLFESLKLSKENTTLAPQRDSHPLRPETRSFFEDRYHFVFMDQEMAAFANTLTEVYRQTYPPEQTAPAAPCRVVLLYDENDADRQCAEKLSAHLAQWTREGWLHLWHPGLVAFGDVEAQTREQIRQADAVIPVLSVEFIGHADRYLPLLLEQHRQRGLRLLPVLHRACHWDDTGLAGFHVLPDRDKPLRAWPDADEGYTTVAGQIKIQLTHG